MSQVGEERLWAEKISGPENRLTQMSKRQLMSERMKTEMSHDHKSQHLWERTINTALVLLFHILSFLTISQTFDYCAEEGELQRL